MTRFRSFINHSASKTVLNLLEATYLRLRKIVVQRVTVVKFTVDNRGSDGTGCFRIEVRTDTAEFSDMRIAGLSRTELLEHLQAGLYILYIRPCVTCSRYKLRSCYWQQ